jgi:glycogen debranching enzyme
MADSDLIVIDGSTFWSADANGDVEARRHEGFFYEDVRHLSSWQVRLDSQKLVPLTSRTIDCFSARIVCGKADAGDDAIPISVRRDRFVTEGAHEDIVLENLRDEPCDVRLEFAYDSDFADLMDAEQHGVVREGSYWQETSARSVTLWNDREGYRRGTALSFNRSGTVRKERATFRIRLRPREVWKLCVDVAPIVDGKRRPPLLRCGAFHRHAGKMRMTLEEWLTSVPELETENDGLARTHRQSILDLASLRIRPDDVHVKQAMPGGGVPWFMTIFGRDSLIASYQTIPFHQEMAQATLEALAELQSSDWDKWRDAEPGKIMHELRRGTLAKLGKIPHTPYYGTHDATMLWLILLDEYERWSGDTRFVRRMEKHARAALDWLEGPADLDGDGYVEYRRRSDSKHALDNHCWKDSDDSIRFADGRIAEPPIATCELQGYAYDARQRTARLMRDVWEDAGTAERLEREADELKRRFNRDYWVKGRRHYALALDAEKRQVDAMTSNTGHLLWSGIVDGRRAAGVVRRLLREDMFSGWGVRTLSADDEPYNPLEYHNGTVWPHDTAIAAEGMRRYGFRDEAAKLCEALLDASEALGYQLPEVFAGFARDETNVPIEYPGALKPQSWAAGAPLLALRTLLGVDVENGKLLSAPHVPAGYGELRLRGVSFRGKQVDT